MSQRPLTTYEVREHEAVEVKWEEAAEVVELKLRAEKIALTKFFDLGNVEDRLRMRKWIFERGHTLEQKFSFSKIFSLGYGHKINLVLDLDHTLIQAFSIDFAHEKQSNIEELIQQKKAFKIAFAIDDKKFNMFVIGRPFLWTFLRHMSEFCNIYLYTHGIKEYAEAVIEAIDPEQRYFSSKRLYALTADCYL